MNRKLAKYATNDYSSSLESRVIGDFKFFSSAYSLFLLIFP